MKLSELDPNLKANEVDNINHLIERSVQYLYSYYGQDTKNHVYASMEIQDMVKGNNKITVGELLNAFNSLKETEVTRLTPKLIISAFKKYQHRYQADKANNYDNPKGISFAQFRKSVEDQGKDFKTEYPYLYETMVLKKSPFKKSYAINKSQK
jgi:hypothetical protein